MIIDGRMPTPEQAEAQLRERLAAEQTGGDALRIDAIAAQLDEIDAERLEVIEQEQLDPVRIDRMSRMR
jgi:hypothetical protein